jgi:2-polyprenyl-3-methyl-5-hydroxy-6-metoxy-1,4-benzoquinol methylase
LATTNEPRKCPLCEGPTAKAFATRDRNRRVSDRLFTYLRCSWCATMLLADPPEDLAAYYAGDYFAFPSAQDIDRVPIEERGQLELISTFCPSGRLVEIGPGRGFFARAALTAGFDVEVIEQDERACRHLREVVGARVTETERSAAALADRRDLDVVVLWQVIEHLPDPGRLLEAAASALRSRGILAVATPQPVGLQARLLGGRWPHVDAPRHLHLIPPAALVDRARSAGFDLLRVFSDDADARRWSRFGWQRILMNAAGRRLTKAAGHWLGIAAARPLWELERQRVNAASYTAVLRRAT